MSRTCEPTSIANQIVQAAARLAGGCHDSPVWREAARREFERYTAGLHDYERQEVLFALGVQLRGRIWD